MKNEINEVKGEPILNNEYTNDGVKGTIKMKIPLIGSINRRTINLKTKKLMVKMYRNGKAEAVESPYIPYFYTEDKNGETKKMIASNESIQLKKHL